MKKFLKKFRRQEDGATMTEYGIMVALIAAVSIGVVTILGGEVFDAFDLVAKALGPVAP